MDDQVKSKAERQIEQIMQEVEPGSDRYRALESAKRFKSSWAELGERLAEVRRRKLFENWGYAVFEDYCSREIRIRKATADKLLMAYHFLEKSEPQLLARREELSPLPDYRSIDLLRQAREEKNFSDEEYADLRKAVVDEERSHPTILKKFKETAAAQDSAEQDPALHYRACLQAARRLEIGLRSLEDLPEGADSPVHELAQWLEQRLQEAQQEQDQESQEE